jgi:hypothetical protein
VLQYPFTKGGVTRINSHRGEVTKLVSTIDSRILFSAGDDGCIFIYQIGEEKIVHSNEM